MSNNKLFGDYLTDKFVSFWEFKNYYKNNDKLIWISNKFKKPLI